METKADRDIMDGNVQQKQRAAANFCRRLDALPAELRRHRTWQYLLVSEQSFSTLRDGHATFADLAARSQVTEAQAEGRLS